MTSRLAELCRTKLSVSGRQWRLPEVLPEEVRHLQKETGVPEPLARILLARGHAAADLPTFLTPTLRDLMPDPTQLLGMTSAVERVTQALLSNEKIVIYGDYDVDGATSVALLTRYFRCLGRTAVIVPSGEGKDAEVSSLPKDNALVDLYIPDRLSEGYGVNGPALERLIQQRQASLILMVDCGTTSVQEIALAKRLGADSVVFDHHQTSAELPEAVALVNPHREAQPPLPWVRDLCSAGLVFLFLVALQRRLKDEPAVVSKLPNLMEFCDLVALGTVCDVMPLRGLNRALVKRGLERLQQVVCQEPEPMGQTEASSLGLRALCKISSLSAPFLSHHLGFALGPRINAGGRIGASFLGVDLLTTTSPLRAQELAMTLNQLNDTRRQMEKDTLLEAQELILAQGPSPCLLVGSEHWHPGVVGIVASRLKDLYQKPSFVASFQEGIAKGSVRSVEGLDVGQLIHEAVQKGILAGGGGHTMAGGFSIPLDRWEAFHAFLKRRTEDFMATFRPALAIDATIALADIDVALLQALEVLEPLGTGNPKPRWLIPDVTPTDVRPIGENHLSCTLVDSTRHTLRAVAFQSQDTPLEAALIRGTPLCVAGALTLNHWRSETTVQLVIDDVLES